MASAGSSGCENCVGRRPGGGLRQRGKRQRSPYRKTQEVLALEFADEAKLYVPLEQAYLVSRYVGAGKKSPPLSSLGDGSGRGPK